MAERREAEKLGSLQRQADRQQTEIHYLAQKLAEKGRLDCKAPLYIFQKTKVHSARQVADRQTCLAGLVVHAVAYA